MPLLEFWSKSPDAVQGMTIEQVVASAGNGALKDGSQCSEELRNYLTQVSSSRLSVYVEHCLNSGFKSSGEVLQDLVNELGRRLDYTVAPGRYQGVTNAIGYDGIWVAPSGEKNSIVIEVKTSDFRMSLDVVAAYREKLITSGALPQGPSSVLLVVGRQDTGELEAQVRGSKHAWDMRIISVEHLIKLVQLKENTEDPGVGRRIRSILVPLEYTRLDQMIDIVFTTAQDVGANTELSVTDSSDDGEQPGDEAKGRWEFTDSRTLQAKRDAVTGGFGRERGVNYVRRSRALLWDAAHEKRVACTVSKRYSGGRPYWYAYHPEWDSYLAEGSESYLLLACMDLDFAFGVPWQVIHENLSGLNTTSKREGHVYWHIHVAETTPGNFAIPLPKKNTQLDINSYRFPVG